MSDRAWNSTLRPGKPLERREGPKAKTGLSRSQGSLKRSQKPARAPRETGFTATVKKAIRRRAGHRCEACGCPVPPGFGNIQHRRARKMGGSRLAWVNSVVNGVLLCGTPRTGCHGLCEGRSAHMHAQGFWLEQHEHPADVSIMLHGEFGGARVYLTPEGGYSLQAPRAGAA